MRARFFVGSIQMFGVSRILASNPSKTATRFPPQVNLGNSGRKCAGRAKRCRTERRVCCEAHSAYLAAACDESAGTSKKRQLYRRSREACWQGSVADRWQGSIADRWQGSIPACWQHSITKVWQDPSPEQLQEQEQHVHNEVRELLDCVLDDHA